MATAMASGSPSHCDVAIVGLGPVGMTLALLLSGEGGLTVVGLDAALDIYDKPRAISFDHESMRTMQSLGLADALAPFVGDYKPTEYRAADGNVLRRFVTTPPPFPLAWPPSMTFIQPDMERVLRKAGEARALDLRRGAEVTHIADPDASPTLTIRYSRTGEIGQLTAKFVVACDGAASFVRKSLGIASEDLGFDEPWLVVDVLVTDEAQLPEIIIQRCDPARPTTYVRGPGRLRRWEFMLLPGDDPAEMVEPERIRELLRPWMDPAHADIWRAATYRFHALVAERWRHGNIFLAGDAAHQTPPFIGQGLNQGIRDVANLAWKLRLLLNGLMLHGAGDALLDTYEAERRPNVRAVISITKELGRLICERDPAAAAERNRIMLAEMAAGQGTRIRQSLLPPLRHGLIARDAGGQPLPGAGEVAPQPWVRSAGRLMRLDDLCGFGFTVLLSPDFPSRAELLALTNPLAAAKIVRVHTEQISEPTHESVHHEGVHYVVTEEDGVVAAWMAARSAAAIVVRPDHIVYGTAANAPDLVGLLRGLPPAMATPRAI